MNRNNYSYVMNLKELKQKKMNEIDWNIGNW